MLLIVHEFAEVLRVGVSCQVPCKERLISLVLFEALVVALEKDTFPHERRDARQPSQEVILGLPVVDRQQDFDRSRLQVKQAHFIVRSARAHYQHGRCGVALVQIQGAGGVRPETGQGIHRRPRVVLVLLGHCVVADVVDHHVAAQRAQVQLVWIRAQGHAKREPFLRTYQLLVKVHV